MQQAETSVDVVHPHWAHRAVATAERLAVHPAALQLRGLSEAPALLDDIVLAHALGVTHDRTMTALLSPSLQHPPRPCGRIPTEAAHAWLEDSARWPQ